MRCAGIAHRRSHRSCRALDFCRTSRCRRHRRYPLALGRLQGSPRSTRCDWPVPSRCGSARAESAAGATGHRRSEQAQASRRSSCHWLDRLDHRRALDALKERSRAAARHALDRARAPPSCSLGRGERAAVSSGAELALKVDTHGRKLQREARPRPSSKRMIREQSSTSSAFKALAFTACSRYVPACIGTGIEFLFAVNAAINADSAVDRGALDRKSTVSVHVFP